MVIPDEPDDSAAADADDDDDEICSAIMFDCAVFFIF
jgi:hypothetical protein